MSHRLGIRDEEFIRGEAPMTKEEIRVLILNKAKIRENDVILDIGAGTGSLSIEAALSAPQGHVYAVEKEPGAAALIKLNTAKFQAGNVTVIEGKAPEALCGLPRLDVILIGGSGKKLREILEKCEELLKPGGRLLISAVTVETVASALGLLDSGESFSYDAIQAQITRLSKTGPYHMFKALNPITIITCTKQSI